MNWADTVVLHPATCQHKLAEHSTKGVMKKYWKNAWRMFRQGKSLSNCPAWNAINLAAGEGTSWGDARLVFQSILVASGTNEPWQRTMEQVEDI